jgi:zinc protease
LFNLASPAAHLRRLRALWLLLLFAPTALFAAALDPQAPLPADPAVYYGSLPNGMQYQIRAHATPPGKAALWLHIDSGSLNEDDNQQGLAHYLEHLAFNGSANFPPGTMIKRFEKLGLSLGRHQNAFTDFTQTTYSLTLPNTKDEMVDLAFLALSDVAFRLTLDAHEIDKERPVILAEARARMGSGQRTFEKTLPVLLPGSRFATRLPIGEQADIQNATRDILKAYYDRWYHPANATLIIVGDIDPVTFERRIARYFGEWKAAAAPAKNAAAGIKPYTQTRAAVITDPELVNAEVSAFNLGAPRPVRTIGQYRDSLVDYIGTFAMDRRLADLVHAGNAPFLRANTGTMSVYDHATLASANASGRTGRWQDSLRTLLQEVKRAREHGFHEQEIADAKKELLAWAQDAVRTAPTRDAHELIGNMNRAVAEGKKTLSAEQERVLLEALLPSITLDEVSAAFRANFAPDARLLLVKMPQKASVKQPTQAQLLKLARKAERTTVAALPPKQRPQALLEKEPVPGTVVSQESDSDLNAHSYTLSNGVRVHLRHMDYKKGQVLVNISLADGVLRETAKNRGITALAARAFAAPATRKLSSIDIRDLLTGKNVGVSGEARGDALTLQVGGSSEHIEDGMRLAHLLLTQGKIEDTAFKTFKQRSLQWLDQQDFSVEGQLGRRVNALLMGDDPRFQPPSREQVELLNLGAGQAWLDEILRTAPIEAAIVGDISDERALDLALRYLGSLPKREVVDARHRPAPINHKAGPFEAAVEVKTITPRARVLVAWRGADWQEVKDRRVLDIAAAVLQQRLFDDLREDRGLVYSVSVNAIPGRIYAGSGQFAVSFTTDPEKALEAALLAQAAAERLAKEGPSEEELNTVRRQFAHEIETSRREPSYWASVLSTLDYYGTRLHDVKAAPTEMMAYSAEDIRQGLRKYMIQERRLRVVSAPVPEVTPMPAVAPVAARPASVNLDAQKTATQ